MHKQWPFFRTLLSNLDMVLAKTDLGIAARYVELVEDKRLGKRIFAAIQAEWRRTNEMLSLITGEPHRLASNPSLARSIEHRFPYLDPLNHLQVAPMRRHRAQRAAPQTTGSARVSAAPGRQMPPGTDHPETTSARPRRGCAGPPPSSPACACGC